MAIARIASSTNMGLRETLEDACGAMEMSVHGPAGVDAVVAVVCDGVGGAAHGEVASAMGVRNISTFIAASLAGLTGEEDAASMGPKAFRQVMERAIRLANASIIDASADEDRLKGMSSTAVAVLVADGMAHVASAGDSRGYLFRNKRLRQLTDDHSEVRALVDTGILTAEQAKSHPLSHMINRYLGQKDGFRPDVKSHRLRQGDILIICTDGLTNVLSDGEIAEFVETWRDDFDCLPDRLAAEALAMGTTDNVTVLCCEYQPATTIRELPLTQTLTGGYLSELADSLQPVQ